MLRNDCRNPLGSASTCAGTHEASPSCAGSDRPPLVSSCMPSAKAAIAALLACACASPAPRQPAAAPAAQFAAMNDAELESAFWACDHRTTHALAMAADAMACSAAYEALKARRFGGDFARFMQWWQENKAAEHARLGAGAAP